MENLINRDQVENAQNACNIALKNLLLTSPSGSLKFGKLILQLNSLFKQADKSLIEREFYPNIDINAAIRSSVRSKKLELHLQFLKQQQQPESLFNHPMAAFHSALLKLNQNSQHPTNEFTNRLNEHFLRLSQHQHQNQQHHHQNQPQQGSYNFFNFSNSFLFPKLMNQ